MGICVFKNQQSLNNLLSKQPDYHTDKFKSKLKSIKIWKITNQTEEPLYWPFTFHSTCSYIIIISARKQNTPQILSFDSTNIELSQMIFGAQFLILHLKSAKKLMLNNQQYTLDIYSFYGDSVEDQVLTRSKLTYFMNGIQTMMQFGGGSLCLQMLNSGEPAVLKTQLKEMIDFNSQHFRESREHSFFKEQLFGEKKSMKECLNCVKTNGVLANFSNGANKLPEIDIKHVKPTKKQQGKPLQQQKSLDQSLPFACQITQINLKQNRKTSKVQAGNIDQQNILFDDLGMETSISDIPKYEQFLKGLFLSSESVSKNYSFITTNKIKLIVNCSAAMCRNWFVNDINYKWIDMPQPVTEKQYNIECLIYQVADIVGKCLGESAGVLIHCEGYKGEFGGARSAGIMVGVLMTLMSLKYQQGIAMVTNKMKTKLPVFMQTQLKQLSKKSNRLKTQSIYQIGSYSQNFPKHLIAKYLTQVQNLNNLQGITNYEKSAYLWIAPGGIGGKIMIGRQCLLKEQYEKYAKQHFRLLTKYQGVTGSCTVENIDKGFRKQPKIQTKQSVLHINLQKPSKTAGFLRNEQIVLKYPILRPIWQKKKPDGFYYTIHQKKQTAQILINKGTQWIGYQNDKQQFFDRIINCYLRHLPHDQIFIIQDQQNQSIFDTSDINI